MRILATALLLILACEAHAQRIIYDAGRDSTASQAATAAKDVASGALFGTMLRNVDAQAKVEAEAMLGHVHEQMRSRLIALDAWFIPNVDPPTSDQAQNVRNENRRKCPTSVECFLRDLRARHEKVLAEATGLTPDVATRLAAIQKQKVALEAELKALREATKSTPRIDQAFALLEEQGKVLLGYATKIAELGGEDGRLKGASKALEQIGAGLDQIIKMYQVTRGIWTSRSLVAVDPVSLRPPPQQTDLQILAIEQAHLATIAAIQARRELEVGEALAVVDTAALLMARPGANMSRTQARIEDTLRAASSNRPTLRAQLEVLHAVAAAAAQMEVANKLAEIRLADQARRFSIRRSAVHASIHEAAIRAASERLAVYWKRGLKPSEIAQFAAWIANTAALVEVARKED